MRVAPGATREDREGVNAITRENDIARPKLNLKRPNQGEGCFKSEKYNTERDSWMYETVVHK